MKMRKPSKQAQENSSKKSTAKRIHHITILDASGSMRGGKYNSAVEGTNEGINALRSDNSGVDHTYTMIEFSHGGWPGHTNEMKVHTEFAPIKDFTWKPMGAMGGTPLVRTCITVLQKAIKDKPKGDPAIMNIFTDGQDTEGGDWNKLNTLIQTAEKEHMFTVTFRGTETDINFVKSRLKTLKATNTLAHDNTTAGVKRSFDVTNAQTALFSKSFASGASADALVQNFYTRTEDDANKGK